jgi:hypothetical protein
MPAQNARREVPVSYLRGSAQSSVYLSEHTLYWCGFPLDRPVPQLINYLNRLEPARFYDDEELARLQLVYDRARQRLDIDLTDPRRERLAILIFQEADVTTDLDDLLSRVVARFERLE